MQAHNDFLPLLRKILMPKLNEIPELKKDPQKLRKWRSRKNENCAKIGKTSGTIFVFVIDFSTIVPSDNIIPQRHVHTDLEDRAQINPIGRELLSWRVSKNHTLAWEK